MASVFSVKDLRSVYSPCEVIWLAFCTLFTFLFYRHCRLIRLPIILRRSKNIYFGDRFTCGYNNRIEVFSDVGLIRFGSDVQINDMCHITSLESVCIGDNVMIASRVFISDHNHGFYKDPGRSDLTQISLPPRLRDCHCDPVVIEDMVWIGEGVCILPGVTLGMGCIVGAGSVVTKSFPPYSVCVGNPAKLLYKLA